MSKLITPLSIAALLGLSLLAVAEDKKEEKKEPTPFTVGEGAVAFKAPAAWTKKQPKSNIIEAEFEAPAAKGDEIAGRLTVMGAGGDIKANIDRWYGQFLQPDGSATKDKAKVEKKTVGGNPVHIVDISGTYKDSPAGPFAGGKTVNREDFRMLAAIIETKAAGNYFIKFYGPQKTVTDHEEGFVKMIDSLTAK